MFSALRSFAAQRSAGADAAAAGSESSPACASQTTLVSIEEYERAIVCPSGDLCAAPAHLAMVVFVLTAGENKKTRQTWVNLCDSTRVLPTTLPYWSATGGAAPAAAGAPVTTNNNNYRSSGSNIASTATKNLVGVCGKWIALSPQPTSLVSHRVANHVHRFELTEHVASFGLNLARPFSWRVLTDEERDKCGLVTPCLAAEVLAQSPLCREVPTAVEWLVLFAVGPAGRVPSSGQMTPDLVQVYGTISNPINDLFVSFGGLRDETLRSTLATPPADTVLLLHRVGLSTVKDAGTTRFYKVCQPEEAWAQANADSALSMPNDAAKHGVRLLEALKKAREAASAQHSADKGMAAKV